MNSLQLTHIQSILNHFTPNVKGIKRESAVFIPLIFCEGEYHLLFEVRSHQLKQQPGEVCFPGGRVEFGETPAETAIRETCEELNLTNDTIQLMGQINSILTSFEMLIHCYVGSISCEIDHIQYSKDEVASLFTIPLKYLLHTEPQMYQATSRFDLDDDFPFESIPGGKDYHFKFATYPIMFYTYKEYTVWGLTARMIYEFVSIIKNSEDLFLNTSKSLTNTP